MTAKESFDDMAQAYAECALWSSTDEDGEPLDSGTRDIECIAAPTWERMQSDLRDFTLENLGEFVAYVRLRTVAEFGHDFWLTRNGHGAGFWDRGLGELGERLTRAASAYGTMDLLIGDDGQIH